jgi:dienelactone hydrolase
MARLSRFAAALILVAAPGLAQAQERVSIPSLTPTSMFGLLHRQAPPTTVTGQLYLPVASPAPFPALVLKAGSGGLTGPTGDNIRKWAALLTRWGVAALVVDSFGPRGISETATNQAQLSIWADVADALAALRVLAADPRIDKSRIGIVGWSRGGMVAMNTALETVRRSMIDTADVKFAAHIVFYGAAEVQYRDRATDGSPMLFFHGESDNYVPIGPTREFSTWAQSQGNAVTFITYPRTYHDFDVEGGFSGFARTVETSHNCDLVVDLTDGHVARMNHKDNPGASGDDARVYLRSCVSRGANLAFNTSARADAVEKLHAFLKQYFHLAA